MRLVSYLKEGHDQLAFLVNNKVYDADMVHPELPSSMSMLLNYWDDSFATAQAVDKAIRDGRFLTACYSC
jgi:fumarylacetoacetate (FAA) hydrolase